MKEKYIWLSKLEISNSTKFKIIERFGGIESLYNSSLDDLVDGGLSDNLINKILDLKLRDDSKKDFEYMQKNNIDIIWYGHPKYPEKLKFIPDKPIAFYIKGNDKILNNYGIAIVGTRKPFNDTANFTKKFSKSLSQKGINIISGLARGIDKYAHLGCLSTFYGGKTIAVLGNGIEKESIYPYENKRVYERILEKNGAIISEYPIGTKPLPYNFPYRNRIISGLADKVIVIQASSKSGSLITVDYSLDQGKDVYVYKDKNINEMAFKGNKLLIEQGAKVLEFL